MPNTTSSSAVANAPVVLTLLPIVAVVFVTFLVIGLAMPVLPLHVHQGLGLGTFVITGAVGLRLIRSTH
jgi:hypothetical protein